MLVLRAKGYCASLLEQSFSRLRTIKGSWSMKKLRAYKNQLIALLVTAGLISLYFAWGISPKQNPSSSISASGNIAGIQSDAPSSEITPSPTPEEIKVAAKVSPKAAAIAYKTSISSPSPIATSQPVQGATQEPSPVPTSTPTPTPTATPSVVNNYQVNVSVTSGGSFSVTIPEGSNQCEVLSKALEQGKISSLNMRFESNFGSNAVYQINGLGKENSVWWGYKVNGQSPSQGCSYIKANSGDNIEWEYKGS